MSVSLRDITPENFKECIDLKVGSDQTNFVASNLYSIAQSKIYPTHLPFAVYNDDEMVGFVMYGLDTDDNRFYLGRLMIDEKHQGRGYGRAVTLEVIERLKQVEDCNEIYLSFAPENTNAERLYKSIGFERTGELSGNETVMRFQI
ncbi:MAG: GNAT family N-acetyltransferase [Pyrinomonadaceae bacterium]